MARSPVFSLDYYIVRAPFNAAPEKAAKLNDIVSDFEINFIDDNGAFVFEVNVATKKVWISAGALNLLWCASYAYWLLYKGYTRAQQRKDPEYRPAASPDTGEALRLYRWALEAAIDKKLEDWPANTVTPEPSPQQGSALHVANELFLVAVAWILLHETGHVHRQHSQQPIPATAHAEEHEADAFATDWMLGGVKDPAMLQKRSLGIAVANLMLLAMDLRRGSFTSQTHPPSYERLYRNLRSGPLTQEASVHAFIAALLEMHMNIFGVAHSVNQDSPFDSLVDDMCFDLSRHKPGGQEA